MPTDKQLARFYRDLYPSIMLPPAWQKEEDLGARAYERLTKAGYKIEFPVEVKYEIYASVSGEYELYKSVNGIRECLARFKHRYHAQDMAELLRKDSTP